MGCDREKGRVEEGSWAQEGAHGEERVPHSPYALITLDAVSDKRPEETWPKIKG